ncbi:MAG: hypothetical protein A2749_02000 [Parcubacteria group bacterium RIFCSPHIGHO2_01_FULL_45_26]|nr:MAG: hypothetical protein A2749_02000 [Parcubacteria group bacterium RIFCSPHIGHO2_01_FULL_45_26]
MYQKFLNLIKTKKFLAVLAISVILSLAIFGNGLGGDFVFDDVAVVKNRGDLKDSSYFLNLFISPYHQNMPKTGLYRPLTMASYALNHYLGGSAFGFRLVNILIHAFNSFLAFWLVSYFLKSRVMAYASFFLFLTHPIHTEAVTSIVGRAELLAFFWSLVTIYFYAKDFKLLAAISFLLALWSKETALMILPVLFYLDFCFLNQPDSSYPHTRFDLVQNDLVQKLSTVGGTVRRLMFLGVPLGFYAIFRYMALGKYFAGDATTTIVENQLKFVGFFERIFTALKVLAMYAERLIWPVHLSADYSYQRISVVGNIFKSWEALLGLFLLAGLIYLAFRFRKANNNPEPRPIGFGADPLPVTSYQALGLGAALFLFPYLMISNLIIPVGTIMGERLMYFSSLGFVIISAWLLERLLKSPRFDLFKDPRSNLFIFCGLLAAITIFYGVRTVVRNLDWKDSRTLFNATVKESPASLITRTALAGVHIRADEWKEAKEELEIARDIYEDNSHLQNLLGIVADHEGQPELAETRFNKSLELNPDAINANINLAELYLKYGQLEAAALNFKKVIEFFPVAEYLIRYAYAEIALNQPDEALRVLQKYAGGNLQHPDFSAVVGTAYFVKGDYRQALVYLKNSRELGNKVAEVGEMIKIAEDKTR